MIAAAHLDVPEVGRAAHRAAGSRPASAGRGAERARQRRDQQPPLGRVAVVVAVGVLGQQLAGGGRGRPAS